MMRPVGVSYFSYLVVGTDGATCDSTILLSIVLCYRAQESLCFSGLY